MNGFLCFGKQGKKLTIVFFLSFSNCFIHLLSFVVRLKFFVSEMAALNAATRAVASVVPLSYKNTIPAKFQISNVLFRARLPNDRHLVHVSGKTMHIISGRKDGSDSSKRTLQHYMNKFVSLCEENRGLRHAAILVMNVIAATPVLAGEEKGKIFDFNLTLPIIAAEFLLLMVALDNIWFKPIAKVMDERDEAIRAKLLGVRDNSGEIKKLQGEAEALIKAARAETTAALNQMKKETAAELEKKLQQSKARIEEELAQALNNLEEQKKETLRSLDRQVQDLSEQIIRKVIPAELSR